MYIRKLRPLAPLAALAVLEVAAMPAAFADPGHDGHVRVVHPGESIQAAVDAARPGDTVMIAPGHYQESVRIGVSGLTLSGTGPATVISPAPKSTTKAAAADDCAAAGHGICVTGTPAEPVSRVSIRALTVSGFAKDGIHANRTDRMSVSGVRVEHNGQQGISQERSTRGRLTGNTSRDNGQSGIFLANMTDSEGGAIDTRGAVIAHNRLTGNRIGVVIRRARELSVEDNAIHDNCGGVFVVGDESTPRAGSLDVHDNQVEHNNRYCPASGRLPYIQGTGILLTGAEDTRVTDNQVRGNTGASPMSGGVVLFKSVVGAPNTRNVIRDNEVVDNRPADLADPERSPGNVLTGNRCGRSLPEGWC
ncbi:right-handed parallel beta-helix repeat-containing protein [Streptomyces palmae]|uniref:Right handed beta helix domain-containing protein n=1 Tax=Streptomyces palmae TaxID=1701085 RepID=A0A4Z0H7A0_9ACTN|nr:right-handed parallel beta-helix repeat-containing protein [Streptomyces palmae]TGB09570.1 hypothetical protein E4099_13530 [Streptomyces palmae]